MTKFLFFFFQRLLNYLFRSIYRSNWILIFLHYKCPITIVWNKFQLKVYSLKQLKILICDLLKNLFVLYWGRGEVNRPVLSRNQAYSMKSCSNWMWISQQCRVSYIKRSNTNYDYEDVNQRKLEVKRSPSSIKGARMVSFPKKLGKGEGRRK